MKLIIEIPDSAYKVCYDLRNVGDTNCLADILVNAACVGTPIPDNATNGDVIKAMFPDAEIHIDGNDVFIHHMGFWIKCNIRWWNAPYQKGGKVE